VAWLKTYGSNTLHFFVLNLTVPALHPRYIQLRAVPDRSSHSGQVSNPNEPNMGLAVKTNPGMRGVAIATQQVCLDDQIAPDRGDQKQPTELAPLQVRGKFLFAGDQKFYVKGVTYGPFAPRRDGTEYPEPEQVRRDFLQMIANGINAIRVYNVPPIWLLDIAAEIGLRVMVGLPWAQHIDFLNQAGMTRTIQESIRTGVRQCTGHPAVFCYAIGNEIPPSVVRWLGKKRVEAFLKKLFHIVKSEDPHALCTYVSFPTTEFLELPFLDFFCFNVYLESKETFEAYLSRLQNLAGDRPLVMAEVGLDSLRNGEQQQAAFLSQQIRSTFQGGAAGMFVFSWTDEWHRGGCDIDDWSFGLTRRDRSPKVALPAVEQGLLNAPFACDIEWPRVSVVICTYNGGATLPETLERLQDLDYPDFEIIVVDDGSTDGCADAAPSYGYRLIRTENSGLSSARNTGLHAANGEIVAYLDDDAYPDPDWLKYLAIAFLQGDYVGVGGPNLPPPGDGWIADCVTNSPGGPIHVLLTDREAEHIPGCNMAFRKSALLAIGGFDHRFRVAGDDVDACWSLQKRGWKLGFSPAALVWHHRRNSVKRYWKQQKGYGRAEALLEQKWPEKYNAAGHVSWAGRVYGNGFFTVIRRAGRIYGGVWGTALFQRLYQPNPSLLSGLVLMPEWHLIVSLLTLLTLLGFSWHPLFLAAPLWLTAIGLPVIHAIASSLHARFPEPPKTRWAELRNHAVVAGLHFVQPIARLVGRLRWGLTPWRGTNAEDLAVPGPRAFVLWSENWRSGEERTCDLETALRNRGAVVHRGDAFDDWDLQIRGGLLGSARLKTMIEEHGHERQLVRLSLSPHFGWIGVLLSILLMLPALAALRAHAWIASDTLLFAAFLPLLSCARDCATAMGRARKVVMDCGFSQGRKLRSEKTAGPVVHAAMPAYFENARE
jgi:GT2 family glycosyltransferase